MTKRKKPPAKPLPSGPHPPRKALPVSFVPGDTPDQAGERTGIELSAPELAAWRVISAAEHSTPLGDLIDTPGMLAALRAQGRAVNAGDLARAETMLMGQATALQTLFARLVERGVSQTGLPQYEAHMRLALKAQAQSRATLETLANVRNGPTIYARQANVAAGGPMQVNNAPPEHARARQTEKPPTQLLEGNSGEWVDAGTAGETGAGDKALAAVAEKHRAKDG